MTADARYAVDPDQAPGPRRGRPDGDEPPDRHEDPPLLLRPGVPRRPAGHDRLQDQQPGRRRRPSTSPRKTADLHPAPDRLRQAARPAGATRAFTLTFDITGPGRRADPDDPDRDEPRQRSGRGASAATGRPAAGHRRLPGRATRRRHARRARHADDRRRRQRDVYATGRLAEPADVLRLLRRRSARARYTETTLTSPDRRPGRSRSRSGPGPTTRPGPSGSAASSSAACPALAEAIGLPWTADAAARSWPRRSAGTRPASPAATTRPRGRIEIAYYADQFVDPPRGGPRLVRRRPPRRSLGERGLRLVVRARRREGDRREEGRRRRADAGAREAARVPLNAWDPLAHRRRRSSRTPSTRRRAAARRRSIAERAGPDGLASGLAGDPRRRSRRTSRPASARPTAPPRTASAASRCPARTSRRSRPARRPPTGAASSTCSRTGPARATTTCGGRGSSGRRRGRPARRARGGAAPVRRGRRPRPATWRLPRDRPRRDAVVAVRPGDAAARRPRAARSTIATRCSRRRRLRT